METCVAGHPLRPGARFCAVCGAPAQVVGPVRVGTPRWLVPALTAAVVAIAVAVLLVVRPWAPDPAPPVPDPAATQPAVAQPSGALPAGSQPTVAPSAAQQLSDQADADQPTVERLAESWVPQVSSKARGTLADGRTYSDEDIFADHRAWVARFPDAVLLRSASFTSFSNSGFWVTVIAQPFPTPDGATAWCSRQGLGPDDCYAKLLSHTAGPNGSTVHR